MNRGAAHAFAVAVLVACGGTTVALDVPSPRPLCARYFDAVAAHEKRCSAKVYRFTLPPVREDVIDRCVGALTAPGAASATAGVERCIAALESTDDCNDIRECSKIVGELAAGAPCGSDWQCASGACSVGTSATPWNPRPAGCGHCAAVVAETEVAVGDACRGPERCPTGSECVGSVCRALGTEGASCGWSSDCGGDLHCYDQRCVKRLEPGATCGAAADGVCPRGYECSSGTDPRCTWAPKAPGVGAPCGKLLLTTCDYGLVCIPDAQGTCKVPKLRNEACGNEDACTPPLECVAGRCALIDPRTCQN